MGKETTAAPALQHRDGGQETKTARGRRSRSCDYSILYYNDFSDDAVFEAFFNGIMKTRELSAHFNEEYAPEVGDRVLILSTCFEGNNTRRFLVMGTLLS